MVLAKKEQAYAKWVGPAAQTRLQDRLSEGIHPFESKSNGRPFWGDPYLGPLVQRGVLNKKSSLSDA